MRYLPIALLLVCAAAGATSTSASTASDKPLDAARPDAQVTVNADRQYLESAIKSAGSREAAARIEITRGWQQLKQGDVEVAVQSFTMAYKLDPKNVEVYWGLGNAMTQQGRYAAATTYYERATKIDPQNPKLMADVGLSQTYSAYKSTQDPDKQKARVTQAMQWFDSAEKIDPNRAVIYANRAIALYILKDYDGAWKNVDKAEALEKNSIDKRFLADLTAKQPRTSAPGKTPAAATDPKADTQAAKASALPTAKLSPRIRVQGEEKDATPVTAPVIKPDTASAPATKAETPAPVPAPVKQAEVPPVHSAPAQTPPAKDKLQQDAPQQSAPTEKKGLDLNQGKTYPQIGKDKRDCLKLKTNEEIHHCVYPMKK